MRHKKLKLTIFGLVTIGVVSLTIYTRQKQLQPKVTVSNYSESIASLAQGSKSQSSTVSESNPSGEEDAPAASPADDREFRQWLKDEARNLDKTSIDGEAKQRELKQIVTKITPKQAKQLLLVAKNPKSPAGEKILSTYLLVESGPRGYADLSDLISAPLTEQGPHPAHSEEEMKGVREKSLRIMGIDGLFAQAQKDPRAKETLARTIPDITDPFVRAYAEDKLRQLR